MRKIVESALTPTIAYKRDTGASGAVSSVSTRQIARRPRIARFAKGRGILALLPLLLTQA